MQIGQVHLSSMIHAYNCTQHPSTTYCPYFLMFGRQPSLPMDFELALPIDVLGDNCSIIIYYYLLFHNKVIDSKTRCVHTLKQRLNFAYKSSKGNVSETSPKV